MTNKFPAKLKPLFFTKKRYIAIYGGRGSGKSWGAAGKTVLNAASGKRCACGREVAAAIDESMYTLLNNTIERMKIPGFTTSQKEINHISGGKIFFKGLKGSSKSETRTRVKSMEDVDWVWFEEAEGMSDELISICTPTFRKAGAQQCYTFNRYLDKDPVFKELCVRKKKYTEIININYWDNPFLSKQERKEAEDLKKINYKLWLHRYAGEPLGQNYYAAISIEKVKKAMTRTLATPDIHLVEIGIDVARYGDDKTIMYAKIGNIVFKKKEYEKLPTTGVCDMVEKFANYKKKMSIIKVDETGIGGGVVDELIKRGYKVTPVNFAQAANNKSLYDNIISEMFFNIADKIDNIELLEDDEDLKEELTTRLWKMDKKGRRCIESKAEYKKRLGRSPDSADALMICFYDYHAGLAALGNVF